MKHKHIFAMTVALLSVLCLGAPAAQAADTMNYFALRGGYAMPTNMDIQASGGSGSEASFDNGYNVSIAYGRRLVEWLSAEVEIGWMEMKADQMRLKNRGTTINDDGKDEHLYGMINLKADWRNDSAFTPYLGFGLGLTRATMENKFVWPATGNQITRDSNDTVFAYQAFAGVLWSFSRNWGLELRGRYFGCNDREHDNHAAGTQQTLDVDGSQIWVIDLGLNFAF